MEYAEKHYVIPQNQLNKLRAGGVRETIQQTVENDLDVAIRIYYNRPDLDPHGKVPSLTEVLNYSKQGDWRQNFLTLPKQDAVHTDAPAVTPVTAPANASAPSSNNDYGEDQIVSEILNNVPPREFKKTSNTF